jgi:Ca-activated chloride channel family protein
VRYNLALALLNSGQHAEAIEMYEYLSRERPADVDSSYNLGVAYRSAGRNAEARRVFQLVLARQPDHQGARLNLQELGEAR